jgi:hypothetical protein
MKMRPVWCVLAVLAGTVGLQGCAQTGGAKSDGLPAASVTAVPAPKSSTPIPEDAGKPVVAADTKDHFEAVAAAIRQQMQPGGRFAFVDRSGRLSVNDHLNDMGVLFNQYGSVQQMPPMARSRLDVDQNAINGVLARYDGDRIVCHDEVPVGTHFPKRVCLSLREIQQQNNNAQEMMRQSQMRPSQVGGH